MIFVISAGGLIVACVGLIANTIWFKLANFFKGKE
jgi:hypothetical protein